MTSPNYVEEISGEEYRTDYQFTIHEGSAWKDDVRKELDHKNIIGTGKIGFNSSTRGDIREFVTAEYSERCNQGLNKEKAVEIQEIMKMSLESELDSIIEM